MGKEFDMEKIIHQLNKGDTAAFEKLFRLYFPRLNKYAVSFLKSSAEAEDLVQEVFVQIWKSREEITLEKHFSSYIFTLVKNRCLNELKRQVVADKFAADQAKNNTEELYHISLDPTSDFYPMEYRLRAELEKIIGEMPDRCAEAFRLKWLEGKKNREIAEIMEISSTMVDKHLAKGLQIARKLMSPDLFIFFFIYRDTRLRL
jgi:RNA polymerase sigma-70 factor (family 1)